MKATGIVRRIDDLGRIVIPKEMRRTLRIREGELLEIFTNNRSEVILKKFSPIGELGEYALGICKSLKETLGHKIYVVDRDHIIASSDKLGNELKNKEITEELEAFIDKRETIISNNSKDKVILFKDEGKDSTFKYYLIRPIITNGDPVGALLILSLKNDFTKIDEKIAETVGLFFEKQGEE